MRPRTADYEMKPMLGDETEAGIPGVSFAADEFPPRDRRRLRGLPLARPRLWGGAGALESIHAGLMARRRRRFFRDFFLFYAIFYLFSREFAVLAAMLSRLATACRRC